VLKTRLAELTRTKFEWQPLIPPVCLDKNRNRWQSADRKRLGGVCAWAAICTLDGGKTLHVL